MFYTELNSKIDYSRDGLRWNAWGAYDQDFFRVGQMQEILSFLLDELHISEIRKTPPTALEEITLPKSSFTPAQIRELSKISGTKHFSTERRERIFHSAGRSYYDVLRLSFNTLKNFVDGVIYPSRESEIFKILEYCSKNNIAVIPYGGGSSVVGGLEVVKGKGQKSALSLDMTRMNSFFIPRRRKSSCYVPSGNLWTETRGVFKRKRIYSRSFSAVFRIFHVRRLGRRAKRRATIQSLWKDRRNPHKFKVDHSYRSRGNVEGTGLFHRTGTESNLCGKRRFARNHHRSDAQSPQTSGNEKVFRNRISEFCDRSRFHSGSQSRRDTHFHDPPFR